MSADLLLSSSSDFWKNNFKDYPVVQGLVEAIFRSSAESYRTLAASLLSRSIEGCPVAIRRQLIPLEVSRSKLLLLSGTNPAESSDVLYRVLELPQGITTIPVLLSGNPQTPSKVYEKGVDFQIYSGRDTTLQGMFPGNSNWIKEESHYLVFSYNPLEAPGAHKDTHIVRDYYKVDILDYNTTTISQFPVGETVTLANSNFDTVVSRVLSAVEEQGVISVYLDPSFPAEVGTESITPETSGTSYDCRPSLFDLSLTRAVLWAVNASEDPRFLNTGFGYRHPSLPEESSESLRGVLRGLTLLRTTPSTADTLESAVALVLGMPVFETDEEELGDYVQDVSTVPNSGFSRVDTLLGSYIINSSLSLRQEILDAAEVVNGAVNTDREAFSFRRLQPLCDDITVYTGTASDWWYDFVAYLPKEVVPGLESASDRKLIQGTHSNVIGTPNSSTPPQRIGDYHFKIGDANRRVLATALTEDFLKWKLVGIKLSAAALNLDATSELSDLLVKEIQESLPVGTLLLHNLPVSN